jgi:hypothetical protein
MFKHRATVLKGAWANVDLLRPQAIFSRLKVFVMNTHDIGVGRAFAVLEDEHETPNIGLSFDLVLVRVMSSWQTPGGSSTCDI